ncbi:MAG: UDP-N-acetylmuramoyl-L-alanyl-D-glutamate--2,6-diaminopimelate ligase [Candidatus Peribacteraceae bacterium]|jgi:UDP-N-acetylmuramoyl-L-alanyl-D-glutamate--2,6-diaminopimelate ligase
MIRTVLRRLKSLIPQRSPVRLLWHRLKALLAALRYGFPARKLTIIGITGTDGKTTTVGMVSHILQQAGISAGALSTAFFRVKDQTTWNATQKTSPSPFAVQGFLRRLVRERCTHAVVEYSSHGLVQGRTQWTWPSVAAVTNTSPEHLDYHGTMEQYRADKGMLFGMLGGRGTKVLHWEDGSFPLFNAVPCQQTVIYANAQPTEQPILREADTLLWMTDIVAHPDSCSAVLHVQGAGTSASSVHRLTLSIPGLFNLENALCAIGCTLGVDVPVEKFVAALRSFTGVPGRMERIPGPQSFTVYVDFTVTPASYEKTLAALRASLSEGKRLLVLTGSCGDRMREKRPVIGTICSDLADVVVVTNEDPYTEDPEQVIDGVWAGVDLSRTEAHRIPDRREAIRFIFSQAKEGDAVLLCGKGSDTTMWVKSGQIPWNEREIAHQMLLDMFGAPQA